MNPKTQAGNAKYTVVLRDPGPNKINVIKEVRAITGLGLKEAKDIAEGACKEITFSGPVEAEAARARIQAAGANVEIRTGPSARRARTERMQFSTETEGLFHALRKARELAEKHPEGLRDALRERVRTAIEGVAINVGYAARWDALREMEEKE